jgi:hypothetical protein
VGECRLTDISQSEGCQGDAKLRRGKIGIQMTHRFLSLLCTEEVLCRQFVDSRGAHFDDSKFRCYEEAVQQDEEKRKYEKRCRF